jgi:proton-translocating NADH-quinone oxidoreductase chain N
MELLLFELKNVFFPETVLLLSIAMIFFIEIFVGKTLYKFSSRIALIAIILPMLAIAKGVSHTGYTIFSETYVQTNFTLVIKFLILLGTLFSILLSQNNIKKLRYRAFEYYLILLIASFSALCLVSANNFITMFITLETLSVSCSLLIAFWNKYKNKEAGIKYLINSIISTAFLLFGISLLYGISGELNFSLLNLNYYGQDFSVLFLIAIVFITLGLTFNTNCVPFEKSTPDIYQGTPYPIGAFLSVVPKIATFGILARIIGNIMLDMPILQIILSFIAILTILYGFIGAINQKNIKCLFAYSSIAHSGFMLLALSIFTPVGVAAFIYYAVIYLFMSFGIWAAGITFVACTHSDIIKDYTGIFYVRPYYTSAFVVCLMALAGLPPTAGFLSKVFLFSSLMRLDMSGLPVYVNLIRVMFDKTKIPAIMLSEQMNTKVVLYFCMVMTLITCFFSNQIIWLAEFASLGI